MNDSTTPKQKSKIIYYGFLTLKEFQSDLRTETISLNFIVSQRAKNSCLFVVL